MREPGYLEPLGEMATLKNAVGGHFHQDAGLEHSSYDQAWRAIAAGHRGEDRSRLLSQFDQFVGGRPVLAMDCALAEAEVAPWCAAQQGR